MVMYDFLNPYHKNGFWNTSYRFVVISNCYFVACHDYLHSREISHWRDINEIKEDGKDVEGEIAVNLVLDVYFLTDD